eukprot:6193086-Pleurochrysis_carterae.AAC.4
MIGHLSIGDAEGRHRSASRPHGARGADARGRAGAHGRRQRPQVHVSCKLLSEPADRIAVGLCIRESLDLVLHG